jgi:hypothetical protein
LKAFDSTDVQAVNNIDVANPAIDNVYRAFLTLSPDDQKVFIERLSNRN